MPPSIVVENLRFGYARTDVLHGLSFAIQPGEVTGLLGPNGAGKSTTIKILTGLLEPGSGRVAIEGLELPRDALAVKRRIGYVPEAAELYETLSAHEFLALAGRLHDLEDAVLLPRIDALFGAFDLLDHAHGRLATFSKGMRQKVLVAAALVHDPAVVFLDEPLTGLDVESAVLVKTLLAALAARGRTILYSSHVLDVVERLCTRVLIVDKGSLVADGSPEALKARTRGTSLEAVFQDLTHADRVEPRVERILDGLGA
ncbi:MAG TPA: ABC transporter ATP-binding protein [Vicinamibacterales bacterium]|jgi:ABC-2 type transport system ATP-binding protein|nr:ABC transporter ATP-binding protein [Vicinamibacterales bacterium]